MAPVWRLAFVCASLGCIVHAKPNNLGERVSEGCVGCICETISNCTLSRGCIEDDCGMFRITKPYWIDAGQPTMQLDNPSTDGAFQRCAQDPVCATQIVRGYLSKFIDKDCNNDGKVDCMDYAAVHFLGGYICNRTMDTYYISRMQNCLSQLAGLTNNKH